MKISPRPTAVSAYLDGKAVLIERQVLQGVDQFERAGQATPELRITVDGVRRSRAGELARFAAFTLAPAAASAAVGVGVAASCGPLVGAAVGTALAAGLSGAGWKYLGLAFAAPRWRSEQRYTVGQGSEPSGGGAGAPRLRNLLESSAQTCPASRQVLYLSGHGDGQRLAGMKLQDLRSMPPVSVTVLDACLGAQLEVLSHLSPWAGLAIASAHLVPGRGMPIEKMLSASTLQQADTASLAGSLAQAAAPRLKSVSVTDTEALAGSLLPALDRLGRELSEGDRSQVRRALAGSRSPGWFSSRVELGSFLQQLGQRDLAPRTLEAAQAALAQTVSCAEKGSALTFDLSSGARREALPEGWNSFVEGLGCRRKPLW